MSWTITPQTKVPVDPYRSQVSLLLHGNGANGSTTITDSSPTPKTVTAVGNAQISTAVADPFGNSTRGVLAFDGSGDYLTVADNQDWHFAALDFTLEVFVYFTSVGSTQVFCGQRFTSATDNSFTWFFDQPNQQMSFSYSDNGTVQTAVTAAWAPIISTWYHIVVCRSGGSLRMFVNGVQIGSTHTIGGLSLFNSSRPLQIGIINDTVTAPLFGYLDELRITKGVARYTANFTSPTAPFPDI